MTRDTKVDKSGCISLEGIEYEVGVEWYRKKILIKYDPFDLSQIELWYDGERHKRVEPLNIAEYNRQVRKSEEQLEKASQSKLLRMFAQESQKRLKQQLGAFRLSEEAENHV